MTGTVVGSLVGGLALAGVIYRFLRWWRRRTGYYDLEDEVISLFLKDIHSKCYI